MGSLANMLLGQAAPSGASSALSGLDPETQAALRALNGAGGVPETTMPAAGPSPAPSPMPAPAPEGNAIMRFLMSLLPTTKSLAPQGQPTPAPPTPEELAARNRRIAGGQ
jgi:hypothetical protein